LTRRIADPDHRSPDNDIREVVSTAQTDDDKFRAWHGFLNERVAVPCDGFVIGEPISVVEFCDDGNLTDAGDNRGALGILMGLRQADLRCLDAHADLGNLAFEHDPELAIRHDEVGVRVGE